MSTYKTQFSFQNNSQIMEFPVGDNVLARIESVGPSIARLYFVQNQAEIKIPEGIRVYDNTNKVKVDPFTKDDFVMCWTDSYSIIYKDENLLQLNNKKVWSVLGTPSIPVKLLDT